MIEIGNSHLVGWESFYVLVGSSAAVLIGLQFVVITLLADASQRTSAETISAFGTPTIVHFGSALLVAAVMLAPWRTLWGPAAILAICGFTGAAYCALVTVRARRQTGYLPTGEDWFWHAILPCAGYAGVAAAGLALPGAARVAPFVAAAAVLAFLFIGIHNCWDSVTYHVLGSNAPDLPAEGGTGDDPRSPGTPE